MKKEINSTMVKRMILLMIADAVLIFTASFLAFLLRMEFNIDIDMWHHYTSISYINIIVVMGLFWVFNLYKSIWTFISTLELRRLTEAVILADMIQFVIYELVLSVHLPYSWYFIDPMIIIFFCGGIRFFYRGARSLVNRTRSNEIKSRVMIVGAGEAGDMLVREIVFSSQLKQKVVCFVDDDATKKGRYLHGVKVMGNRHDIVDLAKKERITDIFVAIPSASPKEKSDILNICTETGCKVKILPGLYQIIKEEVNVSKLKDVEIEDLLGRDPIEVDMEQITSYLKDRVVMVTGGGGSIGSELSRQIAAVGPKALILVDIYENNLYDIQMELNEKYPDLNLICRIASIRDAYKMDCLFNEFRPEIVYHAAAHKHVPLMEDSPNEAIKNNVFGTLNIVRAADKYHVKRFVQISTDKAVNPTNIMGASKRMCEMIIQAYDKRSETEYAAVRFGNVLGSNGSVIPLFKKQIAHGGPVTVTHKDIIRFFMTIPEAVSLVLQAGIYAKGGEIFVLDMGKPVRIDDMARNLIKLSGYIPDVDIPVVYTGLRPGEKLYEELLMNEEGMQTTANSMIHIGKPIDFDGDLYFKQLDELKPKLYEECSNVKDLISEIVPTYHPWKD